MELYEHETAHIGYLRERLSECAVLLKKNGDFPLSAPCRLAAYGKGVRNTVKGGSGSGEVNSRYFVNIEEGLKNAGFEITTSEWLDAYDAIYEREKAFFYKKLKKQAYNNLPTSIMECMGKVMPEPEYPPLDENDADACIYVLSRISGEGSDRTAIKGDILLTDTEIRDILRFNSIYERFMLVLNVGGAVDLSPVLEVDNILLLSQLGVHTGDALSDILLGKTYPSGKLAFSWDLGLLPDFSEDDTAEDTYYKEGVYVGYRYIYSTGKRPTLPFGFGLGYTEFEFEMMEHKAEGSRISLSVSVKNTGGFKGKEVAEVYITPPVCGKDRPCLQLAAFAKSSELCPGESEVLKLEFDMKDAARYDEESSAYVIDKGVYKIRLGNSSLDPECVFGVKVSRDTVVKRVKNLFGSAGFEDLALCSSASDGDPEDITELDLAMIDSETTDYNAKDESLNTDIPLEELIYGAVGAFDPKGGILSVIGNASKGVAGAAGETVGDEKEPSVVMADGPAGLRISKDFYRDEKGAHTVGDVGLPESVANVMPSFVKRLAELFTGGKMPKDGELCHQYATALPIGTAIAQSWSTELAENAGRIVGREMELYGVHLWLAPAMNIQRNVYCGRNFEYYSEDPYLCGMIAAATVNGVQSVSGRGATVKHFAANNREDNRFNNSSNVSERALREIYLKAFEICIRESSPIALMNSYNLINGVHTAESPMLCRDVLRSEFGFDGFIMTDWVVGYAMSGKKNKYPSVRAHRIIKAGTDIVMPGGKGDFKDIKEALKNGSLDKKELIRARISLDRLRKRLLLK